MTKKERKIYRDIGKAIRRYEKAMGELPTGILLSTELYKALADEIITFEIADVIVGKCVYGVSVKLAHGIDGYWWAILGEERKEEQ